MECRDDEGSTLLHAAAETGQLHMVQALSKKGAYSYPQNFYGDTALHSAARNGHLPVVKALLAAGARIDIVANDGRTALQMARDNGHEEIAVMIEARANLIEQLSLCNDKKIADDVFSQPDKYGVFDQALQKQIYKKITDNFRDAMPNSLVKHCLFAVEKLPADEIKKLPSDMQETLRNFSFN